MVAVAAFVLAVAPASAGAAFGPLGEDVRLSFMGPDGSTAFKAVDPSVAYNPTADEYLVVWQGDDDSLVNDEFEVFAQRLSPSGPPLGARIRVSKQGPEGNPNFRVSAPSVAYNPVSDEYLVAWSGDTDPSGTVPEVSAQRLSAAGTELGGDFQVSDMGPVLDTAPSPYGGRDPSVAANSTTGEYLVVWWGDDDTGPLVDNEYEIFGQRLTAAGNPTGVDDFRVSEQGANGVTTSAALHPSVAYNLAGDQYLVAWEGDIGTGASDEFEIWAQRLSAAGGEVGGNDFQVSDMGPPLDGDYDANSSSVAADPATGEYLVVWQGNDNTGVLGENEIFGQRLDSAGDATGVDDFRISHEQGTFSAFSPSVAYDPAAREYLVAWGGHIGTSGAEIWAQRLSQAGAEVGASDVRVSEMGPDGSPSYQGSAAAVAADPGAGEYFVVWHGDDDSAPLVDDEVEIFGQRFGVPAPMLVTTDPAGPADDNNPRLKGSVAADATVDVFTSADCAGAPAANDAPAADLNGAGISVPVADNTLTRFSATARSDGRSSRCSNSIAYGEVTPPAPGGGTPGFGAASLVTLRLSARRIPAAGPLKVRVTNANGFPLAGTLSGQTTNRVAVARRVRIKLKAKSFSVGGNATKTVPLRLPKVLQRLLKGNGKLSLRLTAQVTDPAGNTRTVKKKVIPRLKRKRRH